MKSFRFLRRQRGSVAIETAVVFPVVMLFIFGLLATAGQSVRAKQRTEFAAQQAARAASLEQTPSQAVLAAEAFLASNTADSGLQCAATVDAASLDPGSFVVVDLSCDASLFGGLSHTFDSRAVEVVDVYREGQ